MAGKGRIENLKPFQPGQSGNLAGRAGQLPPEIRKERKRNQAKVIHMMTELLALTDAKAEELFAGPDRTQLEHACQALIAKARLGDVGALKYLVELACGKIPDHDYDGFSEEDLRILNRVKELLAGQPAPGAPTGTPGPGH